MYDPFTIDYNQFSKLDYQQTRQMQTVVSDKFAPTLRELWKSGVRQVVVCGDRIVLKTASMDDLPNEVALNLAKQFDRACFIFCAPDVVEESTWSSGASGYDDYPTVSLFIGADDAFQMSIDDPEVFSNINVDFDTGASSYKIFPTQPLSEKLRLSTGLPIREADHLGGTYSFFTKRVKICAKTVSGSVHAVVTDARLVEEWQDSSLLEVSPNRLGYVGRKLIRDLRVKLELDPTVNRTRIHEPTASIS
jgi:hypothetical protein